MKVRIGDKWIGDGEPCFIIAEAGSNHDGKLEQAKKLIDLAAKASADAVKFQTFSADGMVARTAPAYEVIKRLELPYEWHSELAEYARDKGLMFLSTPMDEQAVGILERIGAKAFKIASGEVTSIPFLNYVANKGKPLIVSTGACTLGEIELALEAITSQGNEDIILLHCVAAYPAPVEDVNLRAILTLKQAFGFPVGFSDHTLGISVPLAAVALGACMIEKHFTLDRRFVGPDHPYALEPNELKEMVLGMRDVEKALGQSVKKPVASEKVHLEVGTRSIFARVKIPKGTIITNDMLTILRPGTGLKPEHLDVVLGRIARTDIEAHQPLTWDKI